MKESNIVPLNARAGIDTMSADQQKNQSSSATRRMTAPLLHLQEKSQRELMKALQSMFDKADDALFELAEKAQSNSEQNLYFESMREVRLKRRQIENNFASGLREGFTALFENSAAADGSDSNADENELSVMENDAVEEMVAVDSMVAKAEKRHSDALTALNARIEHLAHLPVSAANSPLGPRVICHAFSDACFMLSIDIKSRLVLFKLFDMYVVTAFDALYSTCNETLIANNVLPRLQRGSTKRRPPGRGFGAAATVPVAPHDSAPAGATVAPLDVYQLMHQVQANATSHPLLAPLAGALNALPVSDSPAIEHEVVFQMLNALQQQHAMQTSDFSNGQFLAPADVLSPQKLAASVLHSLKNLGNGGDHSIAQADSDAIGLVAMLFQFVLDDGNLAEPMKALISQLQVPMIKVAMCDNAFFSKGSHPARRLLNELTTSALGWTPDDDCQDDRLYRKIAEAIGRVIDEYDQDAAVFEDVLADFLTFSSAEKRRIALMEKRIVDAEAGRDQSESARAYVRELVAAREIDGNLPAFVSTMVETTWSNVLFLLYVKEGTDSQRWLDAVEALDSLLWTVSAERCADDRADIMRCLPGLLKSLRKGLGDINYDGFAAGEFFAHLEHLHMEVMQRAQPLNIVPPPAPAAGDSDTDTSAGAASETTAATTDEVTSTDVASDAESAAQVHGDDQDDASGATGLAAQLVLDTHSGTVVSSDEISSDCLPRAEAMGVGQWVELHEGDKTTRCRLVAVLPNSGKRIFANRTGAKVGEFTIVEIAAKLDVGTIVLLDDARMFDKALASVIDSLRQGSAAAEGG